MGCESCATCDDTTGNESPEQAGGSQNQWISHLDFWDKWLLVIVHEMGMGSIVKEWFFAFFWAKKEWFLWFLLNLRGMIPKFPTFREEWFQNFQHFTRNDSKFHQEWFFFYRKHKEWFLRNSQNSRNGSWIQKNDSSNFSELQGMIPEIFKNSKEWFLKIFWTQRNDSSNFFEYQGMIPQIQSWKNQDIFVNLSFSCAQD